MFFGQNLVFQICCIDTTFGRVDLDSMSEQTLMELLILDVKHIASLKDSDGGFLDIASWGGVKIDSDDHVSDIDFSKETEFGFFADDDGEVDSDCDLLVIGPEGSIDLKWMPRFVQSFEIYSLDLLGSVETAFLPRTLVKLNIEGNRFSGTFDTTHLPDKIVEITISSNCFDGTLNMESLPETLTYFEAIKNIFSGTLNLENLPTSIVSLHLNANQFSGTVDLSKIPPTITFLALDDTKITQELVRIRVPLGGLRFFHFGKGQFAKITSVDGKDLSHDVSLI